MSFTAATPAASGSEEAKRRRSATTFIVVMGVVAMFGDMTYEGARGIVGPYLGLLGASAAAIGFAAGLGEFLGYALRLGSGWLGDHTRAYWPLVIGGYALNLIAVPGLAFVRGWRAAALLLVLERVGKAIRSPARSTLISHAAHQVGAGKAFGLEEALDQLGAVSGPLITAFAMWLARSEPVTDRYRWAFALLLLPVIGNLSCVLFARTRYPRPDAFENALQQTALRLGGLFRWYVVAVMLLGLGFADWALLAFHLTRQGNVDWSTLPLVYSAAMGIDGIAALAFGVLFDRFGLGVLGFTTLLSVGFVPLVFSSNGAAGEGWVRWALGVACWALGMGAQESIFKAAIASLVPRERRGRAYGWFFAFFGLAWWLGSSIMGVLYTRSTGSLIAFSMSTQLLAVPIFFVLAARLRRAGSHA
jgi:hypothetical protein